MPMSSESVVLGGVGHDEPQQQQAHHGHQQRGYEAEAALDEDRRQRVVHAHAEAPHQQDPDAVGADRAGQRQSPHHGAAIDHQALGQRHAVAADREQQAPLVAHQHAVEREHAERDERPHRIAAAQRLQHRSYVDDVDEQQRAGEHRDRDAQPVSSLRQPAAARPAAGTAYASSLRMSSFDWPRIAIRYQTSALMSSHSRLP